MEPITNFDQFPDREPQFNSLLQNLKSESKDTTIDKLMGIISLIYIEHESSYMYNITFIPNPDLKISNKLGGGLREEFKKFSLRVAANMGIPHKPVIYNRDLIFTIILSGNL